MTERLEVDRFNAKDDAGNEYVVIEEADFDITEMEDGVRKRRATSRSYFSLLSNGDAVDRLDGDPKAFKVRSRDVIIRKI